MSEYPSSPERPSAPDDPTDLSARDWKAVAKAVLTEAKLDDVTSLAAGVAFRVFLSLFPALIAAVAIFRIAVSQEDILRLVAELGRVAPQGAVDVIEQPLQDFVAGGTGAAGGLALAGIAGGLWAATSAAVTLMKALSRAYNVVETRTFVRQRLTALALTLALLAALVALLVLLVFGPQLESALLGTVPGWTGLLLSVGRYVAAVLVLVVLFAIVYWTGPDRERPEWVWISPGAVLGVVGWLLLSFAFSVYTSNFGNLNATYGALAAPVVLLLWLQLSMIVLLLGAELNAELERLRERVAEVTAGAGFAVIDPMAAIAESDFQPPEPVPAPRPDTQAPAPRARGPARLAAFAAALLAAVRLRRRRAGGGAE